MEELDGRDLEDVFDYKVLFCLALQRLGYLEVSVEDLMEYPGWGIMPVEGSDKLRFVPLEAANGTE